MGTIRWKIEIYYNRGSSAFGVYSIVCAISFIRKNISDVRSNRSFWNMYYNDIYNCMEPGSVGSPVQGLQIKLEGWDGGGYSIFDKDGSKGEIHVGGERVSTGYFEQRGFTRANFYEIEGKIWNKTGDIGWEQKNGTFRIIDRKRDLINLQSEELVC